LADAGVVVPVSRPVAYLGGGDIGCSSTRLEEGSTEISGSAPSANPVPCPSLDVARPMLLGEAIPRAPSLHRGGAPPSAPSSPRKRRRPRKGYAERVDRRHGSLASSHGRRRNPVGLVPDEGGLRPRTRRQNSQRMETSGAGERGDALPGIERMVQIIRAVQAAQAVGGRDRQRLCWRAAARRSFASGKP